MPTERATKRPVNFIRITACIGQETGASYAIRGPCERPAHGSEKPVPGREKPAPAAQAEGGGTAADA